MVFSSDDELRVAINSVSDNTLRIYIRGNYCSNFRFLHNIITERFYRDNTILLCKKFQEICEHLLNKFLEKEINDQKYRKMTDRHYKRANQVQPPHSTARSRDRGVDGKQCPIIVNSNHCGQDIAGQHPMDDSLYQTPPSTSTSPPIMINTVSYGQHSAAISPHSPPQNASTGYHGRRLESPTTVPTKCSECQGEGRGVWYKCTTCFDFFLCSECENKGLHDHHIMVRISSGRGAASSPIANNASPGGYSSAYNNHNVCKR